MRLAWVDRQPLQSRGGDKKEGGAKADDKEDGALAICKTPLLVAKPETASRTTCGTTDLMARADRGRRKMDESGLA